MLEHMQTEILFVLSIFFLNDQLIERIDVWYNWYYCLYFICIKFILKYISLILLLYLPLIFLRLSFKTFTLHTITQKYCHKFLWNFNDLFLLIDASSVLIFIFQIFLGISPICLITWKCFKQFSWNFVEYCIFITVSSLWSNFPLLDFNSKMLPPNAMTLWLVYFF